MANLNNPSSVLYVDAVTGQSVPVATDAPLPVTLTTGGTDQDVNLVSVADVAVKTGAGTASGSLRVELPTDGTGKVGLIAGSAIIGNVRVDQTTPGTTNGASPVAAAVGGASYLNIVAGQATTVVKGSPGTLYRIIFNTQPVATGTTTIYDHASGAGTIIGKYTAPATPVMSTMVLDYGPAGVFAATGITIITATANGADMTVVYK